MRIDWSTLALQTINALVLIWLLARFLFRPVAGIIAERQKAARTPTRRSARRFWSEIQRLARRSSWSPRVATP